LSELRHIDAAQRGIAKAPTGIAGLDELTGGGLPAGRPTLICGGAGCGKTLVAATFLVNGAVLYDEPGVFMSFEERAEDLIANVASLGFDLDRLIAENRIVIDHVRIERTEIEETGEYDLEGLFIRLGFAIDSIGARRVVLDTIETLFSGLSNAAILRAELRRLFEWLKERGVSAIVTGERGDGQLTRHGLEEYVSDCVILLDNRVQGQLSTRRLRVVKYRGSAHGANEYPFLIESDGISVIPITDAGLDHAVTTERVSTGVGELDQMMGGAGYYRGSSVLISGTAGSGKTSFAAHFADAICRAGGRCLYFAFEEAPRQICRNMRSIGIELEPWTKDGHLRFVANRPTVYGLEMHLASMQREVERFDPVAVVIDPITSLLGTGADGEVQAMLLRLVDYLKGRGITALFTSLTHGSVETATTDVQISSLIDSWILLHNRESNGEHNRQLYLLKSRGMAHSNQVREFDLTGQGVRLREIYAGPNGALIGAARRVQESRDKVTEVARQQEIARRERDLARKRSQAQAQIESLQAELAAEAEDLARLSEDSRAREEQSEKDRDDLLRNRHEVTRS
jgi:circadian clock protein KaiC